MATNHIGQQIDLASFAVQPPVVRSDAHRTIYINSTRMGISPWDIRMIFGQVVDSGTGTVVTQDEATIIMSPAQAKAVAENLNTTVAEFEKLFGEISNPMKSIQSAIVQTVEPAQKKLKKK